MAAPATAAGLPKALSVLDPGTSDDQTSITWHDPMYPYVLNRNSVMHYFEFSPFFDRNSNNMIARRRNLDPAEPGVLESLPPENPPRVEYVVELAQAPHLFVIRKQQRKEASAQPLVLAYYYVLDKMVYQAPTLHAALSTRVRRCLWSLQEGFHRLKTDLDPLQQLLKDEQKRKRKLEQLQQQLQQQGDADAASAAEAAATAAVAAEEAGRPAVRGYSAEDERKWRKAANVIDTVLSQFPVPKMPPEYWSQQPQQQQQPQQPAPGGDAAAKKQAEQDKQQQQQQAATVPATGQQQQQQQPAGVDGGGTQQATAGGASGQTKRARRQ